MRTTFINTLVKLAERDTRIFLVIADLGFSVVEQFEERYPDRFVNTGIAEANAVSIAAGLALSGKIPFVYSIAPFVTLRAFEQVRVDCAYMNAPVRLVGVGGGVSYGPAGATHHAIEDLAVMRSLPNMTVVAPGDPWETAHVVARSLDLPGPMYIRLGKNNEPTLSDPASRFRLGTAHVYREGADLSLLTTGNTFELGTLIVRDLAEKYGLQAELANLHTVKPLDKSYLQRRIKLACPMFTLEEHNIVGGLGSAVAEVVAESGGAIRFRRFGIPDQYSHYVGHQDYIRSQWQLDRESLCRAIIDTTEKHS